NRLLAKQVARATLPDGTVDLTALVGLVSDAYDEGERDRLRTDRSIKLMIDELDQLASRDREQLLHRLKLKNLQLEGLIENMPHGVSMFDADERLIVCNRLFGVICSVGP